MEGLSKMIKIANLRGWLRDDTLIFCDAEEEQLKYLRVVLVLFEGISDLHIHWRKHVMYPINEVNNMSCLASILGGEIGVLPNTYLGMPLGGKSKSIDIWNSVDPINQVLDVLPPYMMSLFPIPSGVIKRLDSVGGIFCGKATKKRKASIWLNGRKS
ncbi:hypothetical protein H5410_051413 [Solanum commersonii]|uniref:Uncharacterized protein n=1 Tax=Solanum commersonii TaxID=4109 RepID=A0A9J5WYC7_SOLCO|nr:hypothetical protein H5410_051413 [Solanum commersonii]